MRLIARLAVLILPLVLVGCDGKPKPAELPKEPMEPPKSRPTPAGGKKAPPPQTGEIRARMLDAAFPV
jgi:hypothetical protein